MTAYRTDMRDIFGKQFIAKIFNCRMTVELIIILKGFR